MKGEKQFLHLQAVTNDGNDGTDRHADLGETKARDETGDRGGELDEESTAVLADNSDEVLDNRAKVLDEDTDAGGSSDNTTERSGKLRETKTGDKSGDFRGELDQEELGVGAGHDEDVVELGGKVLDEFAAVGAGGRGSRGNSRGNGSGGGSRNGGGEARGDDSSGAGGCLSKEADNGTQGQITAAAAAKK